MKQLALVKSYSHNQREDVRVSLLSPFPNVISVPDLLPIPQSNLERMWKSGGITFPIRFNVRWF